MAKQDVVDGGTAKVRLTLFSRTYCHLCEDMLAALTPVCEEWRVDLDVVDVDSDTELERRYNELVPYLAHGDRELARWRLDVTALRAYLQEIS